MNCFKKLSADRIILRITIFLVFSINTTAFSQQVIESFLKTIKVTDIESDGVDIWVATEGNGIYKYVKSKNKWLNFSSENKKIKQDFFYCLEVGNRYIWAGSADGLYTYDKKRKRWRKRKFGLGGQFGNWIRSLKYDKKRNTLWIGRFKYLTKYDLLKRKYSDIDLTVNKNDKTNSVKTLSLDGDSLLWIGVEAGVHKLALDKDSNNNSIFYDNNTNFFLNEGKQVSVSSILTEQDFLWFATDEFVTRENPDFNIGGLFRFDRKIDWQKFDENNSFSGNGIFSLEQTGNYIWVSVYKFNPETKEFIGKGIELINRNTLKTMKVKNNLIPNTVFSMHFDGINLWLGTNDGIRKIELTNSIVADFN